MIERTMAHPIRIIFIVVGLQLGFAQAANAGVWIHSSLSLINNKTESDSSEIDASQLLWNLTGGYHFLQGFIIGLEYLRAHDSGANDVAWAWGPKGGLLLNGFELSAAFLPWAGDSIEGSTREGAGFAIHLGYTWELFGPMRAGVHGTFWSITYSEQDGAELTNKPKVTYLTPQISLAFDF